MPQDALRPVICDLDLRETKGFDVVDEIHEDVGLRDLPIILYSHRDLSKKEELHLKRMVQTMPAQGRALAGAPAR